MKKYRAKATSRKFTSAVMTVPGLTVAVPTANLKTSSKFCSPKRPPMRGLMTLVTSAVMTAVKAAPITIPTARSMAFPREINSLKPLSMDFSLSCIFSSESSRFHRTRTCCVTRMRQPRRKPIGYTGALGSSKYAVFLTDCAQPVQELFT